MAQPTGFHFDSQVSLIKVIRLCQSHHPRPEGGPQERHIMISERQMGLYLKMR